MKYKILPIITLLSIIGLSACRNPDIGLNYEYFMEKKNYPLYDGGRYFEICHGFGCHFKSTAELSLYNIAQIKAAFGGPYNTPEKERLAAAKAVGVIESIVGEQTGTDADLAGTYNHTGHYQLDCVDESINTTNALRLLDMHGLLKHHKVRKPIARTIFSSGRLGPHQTATLMETKTTDIYAIDSWFRDNGYAADVVDIETWKNGYTADPSVQ